MKDKIIFKTLMLKGDAGEPTNEQTQAAVDQYMQDHPEAAIDETIINSAVSGWLDDHPEATTSVQDESLTYKKLVVGTLGFVTPEMLGAVGDGVEDDTQAVQDTFDFALENNVDVVGEGVYLVSDTITVNNTVDNTKKINISGKLLSNFNDKPVIVFIRPSGWRININAESSTSNYFGGYDFDSETEYHYGALPYVGVILRNANRCEFSGSLKNFNVGLRLEGLSNGSVYNFIHGVSVWNCAYGIELYANTGGWVNNNRFDANTVSINSGITNREKAVAVHIFSSYSYSNNCNLFEGDYMSADGCPAVLIENGQYNVFYLRNEGNNTAIVDIGSFNRFYSNRASDSLELTSANATLNAIDETLNGFKHVVSVDANNVDTVFWKSGASGYFAYNCSNDLMYGEEDGNGDFVTVRYPVLTYTVDDGYVPDRIGVFIKLNGATTIACKIGRLDTDDIRLRVYLFDSNKQYITNPADHYKGSVFGGNLFAASNTHFLVGGGNNNKFLNIMNFDSDVAYVFVTASKPWAQLDVYVKNVYSTSRKLHPCIATYSNNKYPYFPINNNVIHTSKPFVGKRLYSTNDGAEYVCTAVDGTGAETWVKKSLT